MFYNQFVKMCNKMNVKPTNVVNELGFSSGNLSKWKNGITPGGKTLNKIAEYFNVSVDYFLGNEDKQAEQPISDSQLKFALFGTTDIDDDLLDDVKRLAKIQQQLKQQKGEK